MIDDDERERRRRYIDGLRASLAAADAPDAQQSGEEEATEHDRPVSPPSFIHEDQGMRHRRECEQIEREREAETRRRHAFERRATEHAELPELICREIARQLEAALTEERQVLDEMLTTALSAVNDMADANHECFDAMERKLETVRSMLERSDRERRMLHDMPNPLSARERTN